MKYFYFIFTLALGLTTAFATDKPRDIEETIEKVGSNVREIIEKVQEETLEEIIGIIEEIEEEFSKGETIVPEDKTLEEMLKIAVLKSSISKLKNESDKIILTQNDQKIFDSIDFFKDYNED